MSRASAKRSTRRRAAHESARTPAAFGLTCRRYPGPRGGVLLIIIALIVAPIVIKGCVRWQPPAFEAADQPPGAEAVSLPKPVKPPPVNVEHPPAGSRRVVITLRVTPIGGIRQEASVSAVVEPSGCGEQTRQASKETR